MKKRKALLILLCLLLSVAVIMPAAASATETNGSTDLSRPGSVHNKVFTAADVAEYFLDDELCTAERNYLMAFADGAVIYNDGVSTRDIAATLDEEEGVLYVSAYPHV